MSPFIGQIAAIGTSIAWSFTSVLFTFSGREVGSTVVNRTRLLLALIFVALMHWATQGALFPVHAEPFRFGWLSLSGVIGYVIGDGFLFQAFIMIGPRLTMLLMAMAPVFSTLYGWLLLREQLSVPELIGIVLAITGTALVVTERQRLRNGDEVLVEPRKFAVGILFGLGAALGQATGLLASKLGLVGNFPALSGNMIRLTAAALVIWLLTLVQRQARSNFEALHAHPRALGLIAGGALFGPFIGVWLSLIAVQNAPLGITATLTSLSPILLLPIGHFLFQEHIGPKAILGTFLAISGTAILFL